MGELILGLWMWFLITGAYCLPLLVAAGRKAQHTAGVGVINVLLGWTVLGWICALAWAVSSPPAVRPS